MPAVLRRPPADRKARKLDQKYANSTLYKTFRR